MTEYIHKRALRIIYESYEIPLSGLLDLDSSVSIHTKNLYTLLLEIFKSINGKNPILISECFLFKDMTYPLRKTELLILSKTKTDNYGLNYVLFRGCLLWNYLPDNINKAGSIKQFKERLALWRGLKCSCKICKF